MQIRQKEQYLAGKRFQSIVDPVLVSRQAKSRLWNFRLGMLNFHTITVG